MKFRSLSFAFLSLLSPAFALDGQVGTHDPSTIAIDGGKFYTFGTGGRPQVSDDGWTWRAGVTPPDTGLAPDLIKLGDRYYLYTPHNNGGQPHAQITMISTKSLDPQSPDYKWEKGGQVASTDGIEDCNGIDPGVMLDPTTGKLWLVYGSYFGYLRILELDAKTGKSLPNAKPVNVAINCEAPILIYENGWYYLLATHGSCCQSANSNYNLRVGRSRSVTGPYLDHDGVDMIKGGGKLFLGSESRLVGPGHFGRLTLGDGVEVFSMHWEADLDRGGASVLDIRPLLWKDGWPVAGENAKAGTYMFLSQHTGTALELSVEGVPLTTGRGGGGGRGRGPGGPGGPGGSRGPGGPGGAPVAAADGAAPAAPVAGATPAPAPGGARGGRGGGGLFGGTGAPIAPQDVAVVSKNWPTGEISTRMANYLDQAQQKWTLTAVPNVGGVPGAPYFKITTAGTDRTLAATADGELTTVPAFTGAPEQLWAIQQLTDGTYRITVKAVPGSNEKLALSALGNSFATLAKFNPASSQQRWNLKGL